MTVELVITGPFPARIRCACRAGAAAAAWGGVGKEQKQWLKAVASDHQVCTEEEDVLPCMLKASEEAPVSSV